MSLIRGGLMEMILAYGAVYVLYGLCCIVGWFFMRKDKPAIDDVLISGLLVFLAIAAVAYAVTFIQAL
ncbi:hypothetical protein DIRTYBETTY_19 [Bacillus phage DirtyBetty]|uniref:Uncharacterized protein n=3 Tax=Wphvirus megatron TaxID=1987728 RepID=A0A1B1PBJ8_9CAUD|nr:hypothetical protein QLX47_gp021 [Bacillus phage Eyuki]YP_009284961.1 hypothetical protein BIZ88_gp019 [Bacillus phage DirtyBetty]ALA46579.1 hypothetical protein EYUKI_21 [Bacillus phage Eyuki]ANT41530.1 hypothetical protein DIRTYBETTY_19 [Bacillus phage DirtyBetty]